MPLKGHCNCNAISVTIADQPSGDPYTSVLCHCTTCKRQSGASGTYVLIADENLVVGFFGAGDAPDELVRDLL